MATPNQPTQGFRTIESYQFSPLVRFPNGQQGGRADITLTHYTDGRINPYVLHVALPNGIEAVAFRPPASLSRPGDYNLYTAPSMHRPDQVALYVSAGYDVEVRFTRFDRPVSTIASAGPTIPSRPVGYAGSASTASLASPAFGTNGNGQGRGRGEPPPVPRNALTGQISPPQTSLSDAFAGTSTRSAVSHTRTAQAHTIGAHTTPSSEGTGSGAFQNGASSRRETTIQQILMHQASLDLDAAAAADRVDRPQRKSQPGVPSNGSTLPAQATNGQLARSTVGGHRQRDAAESPHAGTGAPRGSQSNSFAGAGRTLTAVSAPMSITRQYPPASLQGSSRLVHQQDGGRGIGTAGMSNAYLGHQRIQALAQTRGGVSSPSHTNSTQQLPVPVQAETATRPSRPVLTESEADDQTVRQPRSIRDAEGQSMEPSKHVRESSSSSAPNATMAQPETNQQNISEQNNPSTTITPPAADEGPQGDALTGADADQPDGTQPSTGETVDLTKDGDSDDTTHSSVQKKRKREEGDDKETKQGA